MAAQHQTDFPVEEYKDEDDAIDSITGQEEDDVLLLTAEPVVHQGKCCILPEAPTFLYFLAVTTQYPVVQFWLFDHFSDQYSFNKANTTTEFCSSNASQTNSSEIEVLVQSRTNNYVMYTSFVCNFTAIIPALLLGTLTDKLGRKFVFYISFFGLMVSQLLTLMIFLYNLSPDLLYIASFIQGLSGSYGLFLAAIFGIAADITAVGKKRGFRVAAIEASLAVSTSIGMLTSGIWVKEMGYVWPMAAALGEIFIATLYVFFFIPETIIERRQQPFSWRSLAKSVEFYFKDTPLKRRFRLIICLLCFLAVLAAFMGESNFGMLYLLHQPFCWPKEQITFFNGGLIFFKWVFVLVFLVIGKRCISEPVFALIGSLSLASGYLLKGLATSDLLIFVGKILFSTC